MDTKTKMVCAIMYISSFSSGILTYLYVYDKIEMTGETFRMISFPLMIIFSVSIILYLALRFKNSNSI